MKLCLPVSNSSRLKTKGSVGKLSNSSSSSLSEPPAACVCVCVCVCGGGGGGGGGGVSMFSMYKCVRICRLALNVYQT